MTAKPIITVAVFALTVAAAWAQAPSPSANAGAPNDAQIAGIVVAANQIDIDAAKLAKSRTKNKEVAGFAQRMITDHTSVNKQAVALVKKLKVKPEQSETSKSLKSEAAENMKKLKGLKGADFDRAYIDHEVDYHQTVLDALDKTLIPGASNAELKDLLTKVRPAIAAHLEHAKKIQSTLAK